MGEPGGHDAQRNEPVTGGQVLRGLIYVRHVELSKSETSLRAVTTVHTNVLADALESTNDAGKGGPCQVF